MTSTPQLPSQDDPDHPLNLLPIPELKGDLSNFMQWRHALWFHLQFKGLARYALDLALDESSTLEEHETHEMHILHAYSLIASKIENIDPLHIRVNGRHYFQDEAGLFHYQPHKLWANIVELKNIVLRNS